MASDPTYIATRVDNPKFTLSTLQLSLAQVIFWAATFYFLPATILTLERETAWTKTEISGALTAAMITSALCARPMGRLIDAGIGKQVMTGAAVLASLLLIACSFASQLWMFLACWVGVGMCMAAILYEPCFSIVTRHYGLNARAVITHITLIAGFAATIGFPAANWISSNFGWQTTMQVFALTVLFVGTPLAWISISAIERNTPVTIPAKPAGGTVSPISRRFFWYIAGAFTLGSITHTMVLTHLLPLLDERGISTANAVFAAMLVGPMQVLGRTVLMTNQSRISTRRAAMICMFGLSIAATILWFADASLALIFLAMSLHGATWGLVSIIRPTLTREVLGSQGFGATSGGIAMIAILGIALAPSLGAWIWSVAGYYAMLATAIALAIGGCLLLVILARDFDAWANQVSRGG